MHDSYAYGIWPAVAINLGLFLAFTAAFLLPRRKREWRSLGVFSAFLVALFSEMYGFPLTIYFLTWLLGRTYPVIDPFTHANGHLWVAFSGGSMLVWGGVMLISNVLVLYGFVVMGMAWGRIYKARGRLVTEGPYRFVRHPQYSALFLIMFGLFIQWPTLITVLMWPVLFFVYYRLAKREEREMVELFGTAYDEYRIRVPMFMPAVKGGWKRRILSQPRER